MSENNSRQQQDALVDHNCLIEQHSSVDRNSGTFGPHNLNGPKQRYKPVRIKALLDAFESDDDDTEPRGSDDDSDTEDLQALPDDNDVTPDDKDDVFIDGKDVFIAATNEILNDNNIDEDKAKNRESNGDKSCSVKSIESETNDRQNSHLSNAIRVANDSASCSRTDEVSISRFTKPPLATNELESKCNAVVKFVPDVKCDAFTKERNNYVVQTDTKLDVLQSNYKSARREVMENQCPTSSQQMFLSNPVPDENDEESHLQSQYQVRLAHPVVETPLKQQPLVSFRPNLCLSHKKLLSTPQTRTTCQSIGSEPETPGVILSHWSRHNLFQTPTHNAVVSNKDGISYSMQPQQNSQTPRYYGSELKTARKPLSEARYLNHCPNVNESQQRYDRQRSTSVKRDIYLLPNPTELPYNVPGNSQLSEYNRQNNLPHRTNNDENKFLHALQDNRSLYKTNPQIKSNSPTESVNSNWPENVEHKNNNACSNEALCSISKDQVDYEPNLNKDCHPDSRISSGERLVNVRICDTKPISEQNPELQSQVQCKHSDSNTCNSNDAVSLPKSENTKMDSQSLLSEQKPFKSQEKKLDTRNIQCSVASSISQIDQERKLVVKGREYFILGKLGQGMSGEVLRVHDTSSGDLRAIKCVNLSRIDKETAQGCLEEVSLLNKLQAPCIITMYTYEIRGEMLYVVMEMGDTDLNRLLKSMSKEKQLPLTMILYYWTEMLTAVKHIHDNGVIHSDLKPANFLLVRGRLKLIDFGIASSVNAEMTSVVKNSSLGTLNYISPEAIMDIGGEGDSPSDDNKYKINYKSDVWSLGCILYSLVYGQTPFQHIRADWAKVNAITNPNPKIVFAPTENLLRCGYTPPPPFLVDVMRRCLQHNPKARPTVSQLLEISYVGCGCNPVSSLPKISPTILAKIKPTLNENEWRQLLEVLETRKPV